MIRHVDFSFTGAYGDAANVNEVEDKRVVHFKLCGRAEHVTEIAEQSVSTLALSTPFPGSLAPSVVGIC